MTESITIGRLLAQQQEEVERLEGRLRRRQFRIVGKALTNHEQTLGKTDLGRWGASTRQRVLVMLGHTAKGMAAAQADDLGVGMHETGRLSQRAQARWLSRLDQKYLGAVKPLEWNTAAWAALRSGEELGTRLRVFRGSFSRYGASVVLDVEKALASYQIGVPWSDIKERIGKLTREVTEGKAWMVDRIVRTEVSQHYNAITQRALEAEDSPERPMFKKLRATFDKATGKDSYLLDGQVKPVREPFYDAYHGREYMHPPNRPNDREIMVGWRGAWGDPKATRAKVPPARVRPSETPEQRRRGLVRALDSIKTLEGRLVAQARLPTAHLDGADLAHAQAQNLAVTARRRALAEEKAALRGLAKRRR